jgi:hypothetical protein
MQGDYAELNTCDTPAISIGYEGVGFPPHLQPLVICLGLAKTRLATAFLWNEETSARFVAGDSPNHENATYEKSSHQHGDAMILAAVVGASGQ